MEREELIVKYVEHTTKIEERTIHNDLFLVHQNMAPVVRYTLFIAKTKPLFHKKKLSFTKHDKNMSTHYSLSTAVFMNMNFAYKDPLLQWKKYFVFVKRLPTAAKAFRKMLTNHYTLFAFHTSFVILSVFIGVRK